MRIPSLALGLLVACHNAAPPAPQPRPSVHASGSPGPAAPAPVAPEPSRAPRFVPAGGEQGTRRDPLMHRLDEHPYPAEPDATHFVGQALGAYWIGDARTGDDAIAGLIKVVKPGLDDPDAKDEGFHWQAYKLERIVLLFGEHGRYQPGRMSKTAEDGARTLLWDWLAPRARKVLVAPEHDYWLWGSENHHLQAWFSMWGALVMFADDPSYATRKFGDGSTPAELKPLFDAYFRRWIRNRASRGLFAENNSPTYVKYSLGGFYNLVDFSDDRDLREAARSFLDLVWAQWALEQVDGYRAGSRHRSYEEGASETGSMGGADAWYLLGSGQPEDKNTAHPSGWCGATTSYTPLPLISEIQARRRELGTYVIRSRQPGLVDPHAPRLANYVDDKTYRLYQPTGVYTLDPQCRSLVRETYASPEFILGTSMIPAKTETPFAAVSAQNRWEGVMFSGSGGARIFMQPQVEHGKGKSYNAQWSVMDQGVLVVQRLPPEKGEVVQDVFVSHALHTDEKDGWVFVTAPEAYAAIRVVDGGSHWIDSEKKGAGRYMELDKPLSPVILEVVPKTAYASLDAFEHAIAANKLAVAKDHIEYHSAFYRNALTLYSDYSRPPLVDGKPVDYEPEMGFDGPVLRSRFGSDKVELRALGQVHELKF
jgi:hypothetical protein